MKTLQELKKQIKSTEDLGAVVKTMKVLAAVNIRQFERAVESLADYRATVDKGFQILLKNRPDILSGLQRSDGSRVGAVVFGSDRGMCGQFNEQLADFAVAKLEPFAERTVLALGNRVVPRLKTRGQPVATNLPLVGSVSAVVPLLHDIVIRLDGWRTRDRVDRVLLFGNRPISGSSYRPDLLQLVPLDLEWLGSLAQEPWPSRCFPIYTMPWQHLLGSLIRQFFFIALYRTMVESLASENAARLAAMQVAEKNINQRLDEITGQYNHRRQSAITAELLDIVSGFEALASSG